MSDSGFHLVVCGARRAVRFNWAALAKLRERFGIEFQDAVNRGLMEQDTVILADVLAIGIGDVSADEVMADSPPLMEAVAVISMALRYAYNGPAVKGLENPLARAVAWAKNALAAMFTRTRSPIGSVA